MGSQTSYFKNNIKIQCNTSLYPAPRPQASWPIPAFPNAETSLLTLAAVNLTGQAVKAIQVQSAGPLPGNVSASWTLYHQYYQGTPATLPQADTVPVTILGGVLNVTVPNPMAGATHNFWLQMSDGVRSVTFPLAQITTPVDPTSSQDALAPSDQVALINQWAGTLALQALLDADGTALSVSTTAYDGAVTALNTFLVTTSGAPANWYTGPAWPAAAFYHTGIKSGLATCWSNIGTAQANLQAALNSAAAALSAGGVPTAIGDGVTTVYLWGGGTVKINGTVTAAYTTAGGLLTFTTAPALDALLTGVSDNAQQGVNQINSVDYLTNQDKIQLLVQWISEKYSQIGSGYNAGTGVSGAAAAGSLDAQAVASLGAASAVQLAYDNAVLAIDTYLKTTLGYTTWKTTWPDNATANNTGIITTLRGLWNTVAQTRTALLSALAQVGASALVRIAGNTVLQSGAGTTNVAIPENVTLVTLTQQAAGGNGASSYGAGGNSGQYRQQTVAVKPHNTYAMTVGAVGANTTFSWVSFDGTTGFTTDSGFVTITAAFGANGTGTGTGAAGTTPASPSLDPELGWSTGQATGGDYLVYSGTNTSAGHGGNNGNYSGGNGGSVTAGHTSGGGGGGASPTGNGGAGGYTGNNGSPGTSGSGGGGGLVGGTGGAGWERIKW